MSINMSPYIYSKLNPDIEEIRLITLLPGLFEDPIRLVISHEPFPVKEKDPPPSKITKELLDSLPAGWLVIETTEGRLLYEFTYNDGSSYSSWAHPDTTYCFPADVVSSNDLEETKLKYEALSYTWGSSANLETVYIDESATLQIGQNLACALKHLRYFDKPRRMWIDAVCINQADLEERSAQVVRMKNIYQHSDRVVVWLGAESHNSKLAISTLEYLGTQIELSIWNGIFLSLDTTLPKDAFLQFRAPWSYDNTTWQALYDFVQRPWFERYNVREVSFSLSVQY
jgi:hypothetical protein